MTQSVLLAFAWQSHHALYASAFQKEEGAVPKVLGKKVLTP
jgi:hypothetical protein